MISKYFRQFVRERNLKESTVNGYKSALQKYTEFHKLTLEELIDEAETEQKEGIPLKV